MNPIKRTWKLWPLVLFGLGAARTAQPAEPGTGRDLPPDVTAPAPPSESPTPPDSSFRTDRVGTRAAHAIAPNMFGDLFGARSGAVTLTGLTYRFQSGALARSGSTVAITSPITGTAPGGFTGNLNNPSSRITFSGAGGDGAFIGPISGNAAFPQYIGPRGETPLNPRVVATMAGALGYLSTPSGTNVANPSHVSPQLQGLVYALAQQANPQARIVSLAYPGLRATPGNGPGGTEATYASPIVDTVAVPVSSPVTLSVPTPGAGGVVGLLKMSEDNSPLPRDRVIFNYDSFDGVPMSAGGSPSLSVNRYQFGFEKAILDGSASLEVRLPFAHTLGSSSTLGTDALNTELGNARLAVKGLLYRGEKFNLSGGLGVALPTADDIVIRGGGSELIRVENRSVQLSPFVAAMYTPNDRLFAQAWYGFCFDTGGNPVNVNPLFFGVGPNVGSVGAAPLMSVDGQVGYWLYRSGRGYVRGLAPFVEAHYACDVGSGPQLDLGNGFAIGGAGGYEELNFTTGVTTLLGECSTLAVGAAFPALGPPGRTFDFQVGVRFNYYFGPTANRRSTAANTFGP